MLLWLLASFNLFRLRKSTGETKTRGKLEGFPLCHGECTGAPEKQGPMKGQWWFFHPLIKPYFLGNLFLEQCLDKALDNGG